ncbi:MAG: SMC family ATPase [Bryobacterales bacterium]|nr:SMC family ATPase [Bryobacterales bacterium]
MRPIALSLEGFTSFPARTDVQFSGLDLFAISGPTGAGKTSLLDAMLYALYGRTPRLGEKEARRLVSQGAVAVKVALEFEAHGRRYKIARTGKVGKQDKLTGAVQLDTHTADGWASLTDKANDVSDRVQSILGLDFDGFTRSVMLPQGEFDRFLRGDLKERTQILTSLLNLDIYGRMMSDANARAKAIASERVLLEKQLASYPDASPEKLNDAKIALAELRFQQEHYTGERDRLEKLLPIAMQLAQARVDLQRQTAALEAERKAAAGADLAGLETRITAIEQKLKQTGYDEALWSELTQARTPALQRDDLLRQREAIEIPEGLDIADARDRRDQFKADYGSGDFLEARLRDLKEAEAAMAKLAAKEDVERAVRQAEEAVEHLQSLHAAGEIRKLLQAGDVCPVCEQVIAALPAPAQGAPIPEAKRMLDEVRKQHQDWLTADARRTDARKRAKGTTAELQKRIAEWQRLEEAAELARQIDELDARLQSAKLALLGFPSCAALTGREIDARLKAQNEAKQQARLLEQQREALRKARERALESQGKVGALELRVAELKQLLTDLKPQLGDVNEDTLQPTLNQLNAALKGMETKATQMEAHIADIERQIQLTRELRERIDAGKLEEETQKQLGQFLAADEFIAFVQREALSRLAVAASEQLQMLSDNRYTLALAKGDRERDFEVIDNWNGAERRSVKTLSGGESFLASLSLALALSQGLSDFASDQVRGRLDSLFIDEGISSLDPESLDTAIDALTALSTGSRMVGVISHVAELGDKLPACIKVEKSPGGSKITVNRKTHSHAAA